MTAFVAFVAVDGAVVAFVALVAVDGAVVAFVALVAVNSAVVAFVALVAVDRIVVSPSRSWEAERIQTQVAAGQPAAAVNREGARE